MYPIWMETVTAHAVTVLLHQAFKQTDNLGLDGLGILKEYKAQAQTKGIFGDKWLPRGTLRIWDDNIGSTSTVTKVFDHIEYYPCDDPLPGGGDDGPNPIMGRIIKEQRCSRIIYRYETETTDGSYVPLAGAQVLLRDTFTIGNEITNSEGYFQFDHKRGQKRYIIQWERAHYSIRNGALFQAETRGPKQDTRWDHDIKGGEAEYYGTIHRAAHNYFYRDIDGLRRPPQNENVKIAAYTVMGNNYHTIWTSWIPFEPWPRITIKSYGRNSDAIFGTVTHELSHATHADGASPIANFIGAEKRMKETYAQTIEWYLTTKYYKSYESDYVFDENYQDRYKNRPNSEDNTYTSLMVDLIDDYNQRTDGSQYPIDRVKDYTINQIERQVMDNKTFYSLKNALESNYINDTENYLDELFNYWN